MMVSQPRFQSLKSLEEKLKLRKKLLITQLLLMLLELNWLRPSLISSMNLRLSKTPLTAIKNKLPRSPIKSRKTMKILRFNKES